MDLGFYIKMKMVYFMLSQYFNVVEESQILFIKSFTCIECDRRSKNWVLVSQ